MADCKGRILSLRNITGDEQDAYTVFVAGGRIPTALLATEAALLRTVIFLRKSVEPPPIEQKKNSR